ncbi:MAG TPA: DegT/DnrJ/EryC1/StrS family aminotransferase [Solirubrobacteraceae bacterium]|jgi:dTDP-3-amino-3,4,6-trideoxy-alpha-D-glucose transaminase|nr:DegT/DnrJ/EryC1/StrS family aminotransferase [Solirubrobacteraceae bacterium]
MTVPLFDTSAPLVPLREELRAAIERVLDSGHYILGPEVQTFEREFAAYCGAAEAVGVANGTDAITIALRAMGVGRGDEVVVPSFTFYASAEAIPPTGATPVFCDIDPDTYCVTAETVKAALTPRTKAVIAVHLFGNIAPIAEIEALGVPVLEDAAQAAGSRICGDAVSADGSDGGAGERGGGTSERDGAPAASPQARPGALGTAATFSFFPSKNLGCFGDGGAITTSDPALAERVRVLRFHGSHDKVSYQEIGYNSRLDELQAAILRVELPHLDGWADGRRAAADYYAQAGLGELVQTPVATANAAPAWHLYVIAHNQPERLESALAGAGIGHKPYYRVPIHLQESMRAWGTGAQLPATEHAARTHLAIPMSPVLTREQAAEVTTVVHESLA